MMYQAARDLDGQIEAEVFDHRVIYIKDTLFFKPHVWVADEMTDGAHMIAGYDREGVYRAFFGRDVPCYSQSIADAWPLVEKFDLVVVPPGVEWVEWIDGYGDYGRVSCTEWSVVDGGATAATAPLAICKTVLERARQNTLHSPAPAAVAENDTAEY